jgi:hypothetical protein
MFLLIKIVGFCLGKRSTFSKGTMFDFPRHKPDKNLCIHLEGSKIGSYFPMQS